MNPASNFNSITVSLTTGLFFAVRLLSNGAVSTYPVWAVDLTVIDDVKSRRP
jgi:hypothetical protein